MLSLMVSQSNWLSLLSRSTLVAWGQPDRSAATFPGWGNRFRWLLVACWLLGAAGPLWADYRNSFESAEVSWQVLDADGPIRIDRHQRDFRVARSGHASEHLAITAGRGTYVHLAHPIPPSRVIAEWDPSLWILADQPGIQLMARVVLPRTRDPRTGDPITTLLRGEIYDRVGAWQQLWIRRPDQILQRQVRALRSQFGSDIDPREAYVDLIVLNAYGGVGTTQLWVDDLEIRGMVLAGPNRGADAGDNGPAMQEAVDESFDATRRSANVEVKLNGSVLTAGGVPMFPQVIESNGESFEWLQSMGFNAIKLSTAPTAIELREADRWGIWLIAPPPNDLHITPAHDRVMAWDLGSDLTDTQLEGTRQRVEALRKADIRPGRVLIAGASERMWSYSRLASFLVMRAAPLGTSLSLPMQARQLRERPTLARPGTPVWTAVATELPAALIDQWSAMGLGPSLSMVGEPEQIRLLAYTAVASGARGLIFLSRSPLDRTDSDTLSRVRVLKQLNLELRTIAPWLIAGTRQADVETGRDDVRVSVMQTERAQLLILLSQDPHHQYTRGPAARSPLSIVVPSPANSPQVYRLTPGGLRTIGSRRVAGGIRLTLDEVNLVNLVAITQDPLVLNHLARSLAASQADLARLMREIASSQVELVESIHRQLSGPISSSADEPRFYQIRASLQHGDYLLNAQDYAAAFEYAERALEGLASIRRRNWETAAGTFGSPASSPYCTTLAALPLHWELARRLQAAPNWSGNLLPAGDFESVPHLHQTGWQNLVRESRNVRTAVELSTQEPYRGNSSLRLTVLPEGDSDPPAAFENPPLKIVSAPVPVRRGQLIRWYGWIRIPRPIDSSPEGFKIYDSVSGEALALRLYATDGWEPFIAYRAAVQDGPVTLTFELTGPGEVLIDDVEITLRDPIGDGYEIRNAVRR
jgi:hypothetical protein